MTRSQHRPKKSKKSKPKKPTRSKLSWYRPAKRTQKQKMQLKKARLAKMRKASKSKGRYFRSGFGRVARTDATFVRKDGSLVGYVGHARRRPRDPVCNLTHKELFAEAAAIKKRRSEAAKKRAKNNWWVQNLIRAHQEAKMNNRPLGFARMTKVGKRYSGLHEGETELEWRMHGKKGTTRKALTGARHTKW